MADTKTDIETETDAALQEAATETEKESPPSSEGKKPKEEAKTAPKGFDYNGSILTDETVRERLKKADTVIEANRILVSGHATDEQKQKALYTTLTNAGHTPEEAQSVIENLGGSTEGSEEEGGEPEVVDQVARDQAQEQNRQNVEMWLDGVLDVAMENPTGELKSLLDANKRLNPEKSKVFKEDVRTDLHRGLLRVARDHAREVGKFDPRSFKELLPKAVGHIVGAYRTAIGDLDKLGRSPETEPGGQHNYGEVKEPSLPKINDHAGIGVVESQMTKYTDDMLEYLASTTSSSGKTRT